MYNGHTSYHTRIELAAHAQDNQPLIEFFNHLLEHRRSQPEKLRELTQGLFPGTDLSSVLSMLIDTNEYGAKHYNFGYCERTTPDLSQIVYHFFASTDEGSVHDFIRFLTSIQNRLSLAPGQILLRFIRDHQDHEAVVYYDEQSKLFTLARGFSYQTDLIPPPARPIQIRQRGMAVHPGFWVPPMNILELRALPNPNRI